MEGLVDAINKYDDVYGYIDESSELALAMMRKLYVFYQDVERNRKVSVAVVNNI